MTLATVCLWLGLKGYQPLPWYVWLGMAFDSAVIINHQFLLVH